MLTEYFSYLGSIRGYSPNTIKAYRKDIEAFSRWLKASKEDARWSTTSREDVDRYIIYLTRKGLKPATTNRHISSISSLYRYFKRQGLDVENPCRYESRRKMAQTEPRTISPKAIRRAYQNARGLTRTLIGILATTGIRIQELLDLKWEDIDFSSSTLRVMGKGSKERTVHTEPGILSDMQEVAKYTQPHGKIFYITQRRARYLVYEALRPYSNSPQLSPHILRHTFATELAKAGASSTLIAKSLGHASIRTTQKYINMSEIPDTRGVINLN